MNGIQKVGIQKAGIPRRGDTTFRAGDGMRGVIASVRFAIGEAPATIDVRWGNAPGAIETIQVAQLRRLRPRHWRVDP